jgi:thiamine biosynthesis protein ThiS
MKLTVNGETHLVDGASTLDELLSLLNVTRRNLVVELNGEVVAAERFAATTLNDGDQLELVRFVGGG